MKTSTYLLLFLAVVLLAAMPLLLTPDAPFEGADGMAEEIILEINPEFEPWREPFWEPPSGEIESMLFALQAAAGSLFIGYYLGRLSARRGERGNKAKIPAGIAH